MVGRLGSAPPRPPDAANRPRVRLRNVGHGCACRPVTRWPGCSWVPRRVEGAKRDNRFDADAMKGLRRAAQIQRASTALPAA